MLRTRGPRPWILLVLLLLLPLGHLALAQEPFRVRAVATELNEGIYRLDSVIDYRLSEPLYEALLNGVELDFEVQVTIERVRDWMWNETLATVSQRYQIKYYAFSRLFILTHQNTGVQQSFARIESALEALGEIYDLPLIDAALVTPGQPHVARLRARLIVESLPLPLWVRSLGSRDWAPASDWYAWTFP